MTEQPPGDTVIQTSQRFRDALLRQDEAALNRLVAEYRRVYGRLKDKIDLLMDAIAERGTMAEEELTSLMRYKNLMAGIQRELRDYGVVVRAELSNAAEAAIGLGVSNSRQIMALAVIRDGGRVGNINVLQPDVIRQLLGFLQPESELWNRLNSVPGWTALQVSERLIDGVTIGRGPKVIANEIVKALGGSLTDTLRMTRTAQMYAYREATRANYAANSDIVTGWIWHSALDGTTCPACVSMHGSFHKMDERLSGHYSCRCSMVPVTFLNPNPTIETGEAWLNRQTEQVQAQILGKGKYEAWKSGKFNLSDVSHEQHDDVYGNMRTAKTLEELTNGR